MALGISREETSSSGKRAMMANACEDVEHFACWSLCVRDAIGRKQWQMQFARDLHRGLIARLFFTAEMALQFDVNIVAAKNFAELLDVFNSTRNSSMGERMRQRSFFTARKTDKANGFFRDFLGRDGTFSLACAQFHARDEVAKILIACARFDEQWIAPAVSGCDFRADMSS